MTWKYNTCQVRNMTAKQAARLLLVIQVSLIPLSLALLCLVFCYIFSLPCGPLYIFGLPVRIKFQVR